MGQILALYVVNNYNGRNFCFNSTSKLDSRLHNLSITEMNIPVISIILLGVLIIQVTTLIVTAVMIYRQHKNLLYQNEFYMREFDRRDRLRYIDQLQFYYNNSIKDERYEDAASYKKILDEEIKSFLEEYDNDK